MVCTGCLATECINRDVLKTKRMQVGGIKSQHTVKEMVSILLSCLLAVKEEPNKKKLQVVSSNLLLMLLAF